MNRGFFSGLFSGTVVSLAFVVIVSLGATEPVRRAPPQAPQTDTASVPAPAGQEPAPTAAEAPELPATVNAPPAPAAPDRDAAATAPPDAPAPAPEVLSGLQTAPEPPAEGTLPQTAEQGAPVEAASPEVAAAPEPEATPRADAEPPASPEVVAAPEIAPQAVPESAPSAQIAPPAGTLALQGEGAALPAGTADIKVNRPETVAPAPAESLVVELEAEPAATGEAADALARFAAQSGASGTRPMMSVVLIDDGRMAGGPAALAASPVPVTIAIDATLPDAIEKLAGYRAAGLEVLAMIPLPDGATSQDAAVALEAGFNTLPETIGLFDMGGGELASNRFVAGQVMTDLLAAGRGFVSAAGGLDMAAHVAEAAGVPVIEVYRDIDGAGQDARAVRRFLDQAAFRARQASGVVVLGRVRPETVSALILWGAANQTLSLDLVPVSTLLLR